MADLATLESALRKADAAGDTYAAGRFAQEIRTLRSAAPAADPAALAKEAAASLPYKMGQAGAQPAQSFPSYAAQSLIEGAPSTAGAIMGARGGPLGMGAMAGVGETLRQAAKSLTHPSVMPGVQNRLDLAPVAMTAASTAAIPGVLVGGSKLVGNIKDKFVKPVFDLFEQGGEKDLATKYIRDKVLGEKTLPAVMEAARNVKEYIPGGQPTMAQAVGGIPAGSPIQAHQQVIAKSPKDVSAAFGERTANQQMAEALAATRAKTETVPKGLAVLDRVNAQGGVPAQSILSTIDQRLAIPEVTGDPISKKALNDVKESLAALADEQGMINARALYQYKKVGVNRIVDAALAGQKPDVAKDFKAVNLIQVKKEIDEAIERSGGTGWKDYLKEYGDQMGAIKNEMMRREAQYKPLQKTNLTEPEVDKLQIANVLDRPVSYANALIRHFKGDVNPRLKSEFEHLYLDPKYFVQQMEQVPVRYRPMVEALLKQAGGVTGAQMGAQIAHTP